MKNLVLIKKYALNYLSKYDSSKYNLERVLHNKIRRISSNKKEKFILYNAIPSFLLELESKKIINDKNYTNTKLKNFSTQGKSKNFIKSYLIHKGIEKKLIDEIFHSFELNNVDWELESAKIFARKKRLGIKNTDNKEKDLAKMARAGFDYNISKKTLGLD